MIEACVRASDVGRNILVAVSASKATSISGVECRYGYALRIRSWQPHPHDIRRTSIDQYSSKWSPLYPRAWHIQSIERQRICIQKTIV